MNNFPFLQNEIIPDFFGIYFSAAPNTTTTTDKLIENEVYITGAVFCANTFAGSKVTIQVVDKDDILGLGANAVLFQPVTDWYFTTGTLKQEINLGYGNKAMANLYIRIIYTNSDLSTASLCSLNIMAHKAV